MLNCLKTQIFRILQLSSYLLENGSKSHQKKKTLNSFIWQIFVNTYNVPNASKSTVNKTDITVRWKKKTTEDPLPQLSLREISIVQGLIKLNISNQVSQVHIYFVVNLIILKLLKYEVKYLTSNIK